MARYDNESPLYSKSRICSFRHLIGMENCTGGRKLSQHHIQHHHEYKPESETIEENGYIIQVMPIWEWLTKEV